MTNPLATYAQHLHSLGYAPLPIAPDGTKRPSVSWANYQDEQPSSEDVARWFAGIDTDGIGIVCGAASGHLEMVEVEGHAAHLAPVLATLMADNEFGDLWGRIASGWVEVSPTGGMHWHYRISDGPARRNTKLARRPATEAEQAAKPGEKIKVLIETRGQGGFTVLAPSAGRTHATGAGWVTIVGGPDTVPTITVDERDALYAIAGMLDETPVITHAPLPSSGTPYDVSQGLRPGDDYNAKATWDDILVPHGWQRIKKLGAGWGWVRPGKEARDGISATTGTAHDGVDRLYVFSSSTEFETERPYDKFAAYALLEHNGDHSAAAAELRKQDYGTESSRPVTSIGDLATLLGRPEPSPGQQQHQAHGTDGSLATVTQLQPRAARTLLHSDDANALSLVDHHGDRLRHCSDRGRWYAWDGHVWAECHRTAGTAREAAKDIARTLPEESKKDVDHKKRSLSAVGITAMLIQAASDPRISVTYDQLDAHPWELNTPGGIVDLRTGELGPHDPDKLHTRTTTCTPDPDADRTQWLRFLDTTFGGDQALIGYLQRLVGYSAVGVVGAHVLPYCHGSGGNGKGVFLETCVKVLGGYATTAPAGFLMAKTHASHETEVARLAGARMVLCSEVNDDDRFDEARVKLLTGGDTLTARFMQQDHFTFTPTHQLWAMGNHQPHVRSGGRAFWRRLRLIPFLHEVAPGDVVDGLQDILASDAGPAVLSWIVEGAAAYHRDGLQEPDAVKAATGEYEADQDTVTRFLEEMCRVGGGSHVTVKMSIVRSAYEDWCRDSGDEPVSTKAFGMALRRHGVATTRTSTAKMYMGLSLLGTDDGSVTSDQGWHL